MSRRQLTTKQHSFLEYLKVHVTEHKVWPTYREIVDHFDYRSPNSVTQNLQALTKKGFLRRDHNGYHLVDHQNEDGAIPVRSVLRGEHLSATGAAERFSLATLFPGLKGLHAVRLDGAQSHTQAFEGARYLLLTEDEVGAGALAVVLNNGILSLRRKTEDGQLVDPDGQLPALPTDGAHVLGRYAGHAGPYGVVRHKGLPSAATTTVSASAMAEASFA